MTKPTTKKPAAAAAKTAPKSRAPKTTPVASTDRVERFQLAKAEAAALKAWQQGGNVGERPATPNRDAVGAKQATTKTKGAGTATRGALQAKLAAFMVGREAMTPFAIAQELGGHSSGAVSYSLDRMAAAGVVKLESDKPKKYVLA